MVKEMLLDIDDEDDEVDSVVVLAELEIDVNEYLQLDILQLVDMI